MAAEKPVQLGPFQSVLDSDQDGVIRKELVIYRKTSGHVIRESAVREYHTNGDYHDSIGSTPIVKGDL